MTRWTPGLAIPAFSCAIGLGRVAEKDSDGRRRAGRCRRSAGSGMTLVASSRPPSPTSTMQASAGWRAKARKAAAVVDLEEARRPSRPRRRALRRAGSPAASSSISSPGDADALVEADEVRAGVDVRGKPRRLDRRAQEGAGRALAVGAGDVEHRRQIALGIAEPVEQGANPLQPENIARRATRPPAGRAGAGPRDDRRMRGRPRRDRSLFMLPPAPASDRRSIAPAAARRSRRWTTMSIMP